MDTNQSFTLLFLLNKFPDGKETKINSGEEKLEEDLKQNEASMKSQFTMGQEQDIINEEEKTKNKNNQKEILGAADTTD